MKRSPLKAAPLHNPGQSLDEEINRILDDDVSRYAMILVAVIVLAILEWWRWYLNVRPNPLIYTAIALVVSPYALYKLRSIRRRIKQLRLGRDGERIVGQYLEELRAKGYKVLHDIVGDGFNVDHIVLSQKGIFVVETKTISKPDKGDAKITVSTDKLLVDDMVMDRDPIVQVKASTKWLCELLMESTGKEFPVRPVVLFPGWYVEGRLQDVWVLNPKALPAFIDNEKMNIKQDDVQLATYHLSSYMRALATR